MGGVYGIFFVKLDSQKKEKPTKLPLEELPIFLEQKDFEKTIEVQCSENRFRCFLIVDGELSGELEEILFDQEATVYSYERRPKRIDFPDLKLEQLERHTIFFRYQLNRFGKSKDMIVETQGGVYIFNSIYKKPIKIESMADIDSYFESIEKKVKDVF